MVNQRLLAAPLLALLAMIALSCGSNGDGDAGPEAADGLRIASFDFAESALLAEMYAQAAEAVGVPVVRLGPVGPREIVAPALELGRIDLVPEYLGSALANWGSPEPNADRASSWNELNRLVNPRGLQALEPALAEDTNAFAVTATTAGDADLSSLSDLIPLAPTQRFGGPPECPDRPLCLLGLQEVYGLEFAEFVPQRSLQFTAEALRRGEIDVGLMFSTAPELLETDLVVLTDDRFLQPAENIIPLARTDALGRWGPRVAEALRVISGELSTIDLRLLNLRVAEGETIEEVAQDWLAQQTAQNED